MSRLVTRTPGDARLRRTPVPMVATAGALALSGVVVLALVAGPAGAAGASPVGHVEHWGSYFGDFDKANNGQLLSPTDMTLPGPVKEVATSNSTEYALLRDGTVYAWGQGDNGELGDGAAVNSFTVPVKVDFPVGVVIASLPTDAMPYDTGLALDTTGHAWGWGANTAGQLCNGHPGAEDTPIEVPVSGVVTQLAGAGDHALYLAGRKVYACGGNGSGDLGDATMKASAKPVAVRGLDGKSVATLVAAYQNSGALLTDGDYFNWGLNSGGQLGNGKTAASDVPVEVRLKQPAVQVVQGGSIGDNGQTLVELADGSVFGWGSDGCGQLLDGGGTSKESPVKAIEPKGVTFKTLATGGQTSYAISTTGDVYAWGCGAEGELGNGKAGNSTTAILVETGMSQISATAENVDTAR